MGTLDIVMVVFLACVAVVAAIGFLKSNKNKENK